MSKLAGAGWPAEEAVGSKDKTESMFNNDLMKATPKDAISGGMNRIFKREDNKTTTKSEDKYKTEPLGRKEGG